MKTTDEVIAEMDLEFTRAQADRRAAHEDSKRFVKRACNAGLIDDVVPTGPSEPIVVQCLGCGALVPEPDVSCRRCPMGTPVRMS